MTLNNQKEQFSSAYAQAVASVAGLKISKCEVDDDSIDITIERSGGLAERLDIQLKCTASSIPVSGDLSFPLKLKNYEDLSRVTIMPRILVVLFVPKDSQDWMKITEEQALIRHSAWWVDLKDSPSTDNDTSVTVTIPRDNLFRPEILTKLLDETRNQFTPA
ncbi:DUF4365 domain-containing protein [Roseibacillus persicicus]|uniref:DUF4365 domain-containing protein n=1 Tax=Roseibacillus persicicus TaxID=454148 RepID=A0A918TFR0_9BACT|nr:DUF4365 domain-containing protein [Roseibacillus persicicus]GHC44390.1 hypothetical protein GCM10007100_07090 [Roseibacillus persicicus]